MEIIYLLVPLSLLLLGLAVSAFFWAVKHRQFHDMDTSAHQILEPDHPVKTCDWAECDGRRQPNQDDQKYQNADVSCTGPTLK